MPHLPNPYERPTVDVPMAGAAFGISPRTARTMVKEGRFPVPVLRVGNKYRVATASLYEALCIPIPESEAPLHGYTDERTA